MNGTPPKIEIIAPLSRAMELMKRILFRPFNFEKWLVIGFAAFLAHLGGGGRFNLNLPSGWRHSPWREQTWNFSDQIPSWVWPLMFVGVPVGIALVILCAWIGARGRFIFTDCVVRDRAAIVAPWHEYRKEGNSLFVFTLIVALVLLGLFAIGVLPLMMPALRHHGGMTFTLGSVFCIVLLIIAALSWWIISQFMVPVMYRQRCSAWAAFEQTLSLITSHAAEVILFIVFLVVISVGIAIAVLMVGLLTCCVGLCLFSLPYIGTVILLPVEILLFGYTLFFLRQFGNEFDVWATLEAPAAESLVSSPPPEPPTVAAPPEPPPTEAPPAPPPRSPYEPPEPPPQT